MKLTMREILIAGQMALDEDRLAIQHGLDGCKYRDMNNTCCIIGAAIDDETAKKWDEIYKKDALSSAIDHLYEMGEFEADLAEVDDMRELQTLHDYGDFESFMQAFAEMEKKYL